MLQRIVLMACLTSLPYLAFATVESITGVGIVLNTDLSVEAIVPDSPAALSGLVNEKDTILAVKSRPGLPWLETEGLPLPDVIDAIRGPEGTMVMLRLKHPDGRTSEIVLTRARLNVGD